MTSSKRSYRFEPSGYFNCMACGEKTFANSTKVRLYFADEACSHPALKELGHKRICPPCYNWDYDAHRRMRLDKRKPLSLKGAVNHTPAERKA